MANLPPVTLTSQEDHRRTLDLLGIDTLRPGRNGLNPDAPDYANYDESKATLYPDLPELMVLNNGNTVNSAKSWKKRRAEIVEIFDREIYGRQPATTPSVTWEIVSQTEGMEADIPVTIQELVGHLDNSAYPQISVNIEMTLTTPRNVDGPVPAIVHFTYKWPAGRPRREPPPGPTPLQQVLGKGWAFAELTPTTAQADNGAGLTEGVIGLVNKGQPRNLEDWGALRAWGWAASRALDYFEQDPKINAKHVAIEGMSRYGKAVLVTMAYDTRFAAGFAGSSGAGGASLWRRDIGEIVENVASSGEYHWMAGNFMKYAGPLNWDDLPIDAHELIALSAPRALFVGSGLDTSGDAWVDAKGMYLATLAANPAYEVLGAKGIKGGDFPPAETSLTDGELAFRQHAGGHTNGPNWEYFLEYADPYLDPKDK
ncbi:MAG: acetylxylan esterase [Alphaproteobacteria bacterium]|nr:MAG: acetylxylan esterase [Alphaproteobacteria bacterium]